MLSSCLADGNVVSIDVEAAIHSFVHEQKRRALVCRIVFAVTLGQHALKSTKEVIPSAKKAIRKHLTLLKAVDQ
jgi:hypothetical protein